MTRTAIVYSLFSSPWLLEVSMWVSQANMAPLGRQFFINFSMSVCFVDPYS